MFYIHNRIVKNLIGKLLGAVGLIPSGWLLSPRSDNNAHCVGVFTLNCGRPSGELFPATTTEKSTKIDNIKTVATFPSQIVTLETQTEVKKDND